MDCALFQGPHGTVTCMTAVGEDELKPDHCEPLGTAVRPHQPGQTSAGPSSEEAQGAARPSQSVADVTLEWHRPREHASVLCPVPQLAATSEQNQVPRVLHQAWFLGRPRALDLERPDAATGVWNHFPLLHAHGSLVN